MTYCVILKDHVLQEDYIEYVGHNALAALKTMLQLEEGYDPQFPTFHVELETMTTQKEQKIARRIKTYPTIDPEPLGFTEVEEEYPY